MKQLMSLPGILLVAALAVMPRALAQDDVTIPKSRLEELERKENELERLQKKPAPPAEKPVQQLAPPASTNSLAPISSPPPQPVVTRPSPPLTSLPAYPVAQRSCRLPDIEPFAAELLSR